MIYTHILYVIIYYTGMTGGGAGVTVNSTEFYSEQSCNTAASIIKKTEQHNDLMNVVCVKK